MRNYLHHYSMIILTFGCYKYTLMELIKRILSRLRRIIGSTHNNHKIVLLDSNMKFTKLVLSKLNKTLSFYGFRITMERKNYVQLESKFVVMAIYYDEREHCNNINLGRNGGNFQRININTEILNEYFDSDVALDKISIYSFLDFLNQFFEGKGKPILEGDVEAFQKFEKYFNKRCEEYTKKYAGGK